MEVFVYDVVSRRIGLIIMPLLFVPLIMVFGIVSTSPVHGQNLPVDLLLMLAPIAIGVGSMSLFMIIAMGVRVKIDRPEGKVFRLYSFLGATVRKTEYALAQFDRISLTRGGRGGYRVSLVGREHDVIFCYATSLKLARQTADDAASYSGLSVSDQI